MMLKRKSSLSERSLWSLLRAGVAGLVVAVGGAGATVGCLDRPVAPAVPKTSNIYVDEIRQTAVDKIDLLFMIDNSISMADKQEMLADAVPVLVRRLITPICVDDDDRPVGGNADADGKCASGSPEFNPIKDIHVGIVTSSLGSHGANGTNDQCTEPSKNEHAHLLGALRPDLSTYQNAGFLKWDTTSPAKYPVPGESDPRAFEESFTKMVVSADEHGCGFEASLEAWYRFLIDPEPPLNVVRPIDPMTNLPGDAVMEGTDQALLEQRKAFLRPDSLVAIVMLSDENDCSIVDEGYGFLIASQQAMYRSTSVCATNPNDKCCQSCGERTPNEGCGPIHLDSQCQLGERLKKAQGLEGEDDVNLRCWQQKRRFGFELLHPISRYVRGLREETVPNRAGADVTNPLFAAGAGTAPRAPGLVFFAGIIGVPWQDIADEASLNGPGLRYLTATEMSAATPNRWATILGDPDASPPVPPADPLMIESVEERTGVNPITNDALAPSTSTNPLANPINGHEQTNAGNNDLQYACIFPLKTPVDCDDAKFAAKEGCDCFADDDVYNRPLCQQPGGAQGITQRYGKAYPGLRHLQTLRDFGENSIVASICPKVLEDHPDYGYNPAVKAIIARLIGALRGKCLPRELDIAEEDIGDPERGGLGAGQVPCAVVEAVLPENGAACGCDEANGRRGLETRPELRASVLKKLAENKTCGADGISPCDAYCTCEIRQFAGEDLTTCQNSENPPKPGYCYVNAAPPPEVNVGDPKLVADCPADSKRLLNFGVNTPASGAIALVACLGASLGSE